MLDKTAISEMSPLRQTWIISAVAVLLSFVLTAIFYYSVYGEDDRFWEAMIMALSVPWGIAIPIGWYMTRQRQRLVLLTNRLKATREELRQANRELAYKATYDSMTGLLNRDGFLERLTEMRTHKGEHQLMIVDVDHFKHINDSFGHPVGDKALILLAGIFNSAARDKDLIGRIGGEEFGIFLPDTDEIEGQAIAEMLRQKIEKAIFEPQAGFRHVITVSIGMTKVTANCDQSTVMRYADNALFSAKDNGRNQVIVFEHGMRPKPRPTMAAINNSQVGVRDSLRYHDKTRSE